MVKFSPNENFPLYSASDVNNYVPIHGGCICLAVQVLFFFFLYGMIMISVVTIQSVARRWTASKNAV